MLMHTASRAVEYSQLLKRQLYEKSKASKVLLQDGYRHQRATQTLEASKYTYLQL